MNPSPSFLLLLDVSAPWDRTAVGTLLEALRAHPDAESVEVQPFGDGLMGPHFTWRPSGFVHPQDWLDALPVPPEGEFSPMRGEPLWLAHAWRDLGERPDVQDGRVQIIGFLTDLSRPLPSLEAGARLPPSAGICWLPATALEGEAQGRLEAWGRDVAALTNGPEARILLDWATEPEAASRHLVFSAAAERPRPRP